MAAAADEPAPAEEAAEPERAPPSTTLDAPAPAETPAPLLAPPPRPDSAPEPEPAVTKELAPDPRFGDPGQIALNGSLSASVGHLGYDSTDNTSTTVNVAPAFDYFSARNFSEGVTAFFRYGSSQSGGGRGGTSTSVGATARVGHNVWLDDRLSFWPKLAFGVWHTWYSYSLAFASGVRSSVTIDGLTIEIGPSQKLSENVFFAEIEAPFLFHLAPHFYVGFGPDVFVDLVHSVESVKNLRRFVGAFSTLGGWF